MTGKYKSKKRKASVLKAIDDNHVDGDLDEQQSDVKYPTLWWAKAQYKCTGIQAGIFCYSYLLRYPLINPHVLPPPLDHDVLVAWCLDAMHREPPLYQLAIRYLIPWCGSLLHDSDIKNTVSDFGAGCDTIEHLFP